MLSEMVSWLATIDVKPTTPDEGGFVVGPPQHHQRLVSGDRVQPGAEMSESAVRRDVVRDGDEGLLRDVVSERDVGDPRSNRTGSQLESVDELQQELPAVSVAAQPKRRYTDRAAVFTLCRHQPPCRQGRL